MKKQNTNFEEKFDDVMHYVKVRLDGQGKSVKVQNEEDLRQLIELLDEKRQDKRGERRFSDDFVTGLVKSTRAKRFIGKKVGNFGEAQRLKPRAQLQRERGRQIYYYRDRTAIKIMYQYRNKAQVRFKDTETGRFIKKSEVSEEE